jgi:Ribonuclease HII
MSRDNKKQDNGHGRDHDTHNQQNEVNHSSKTSDDDKRQCLLNGMYCYCLHPSTCSKCGKPMSTQSETRAAMKVLLGQDHDDYDNHKNNDSATPMRPSLANVFGIGPLLVSHVPESATRSSTSSAITTTNNHIEDQGGVHVGIDEAGRGSVMGPMVYGAAYWNPSMVQHIPKGFQDSKALTDDVRSKLLDQLMANDHIGFVVRALQSTEISRNMLRPDPYNLNQMSHDGTFA